MDATTLRRLILKVSPKADKGMATHILAACHTTGLPLSYGLALVQKETDFQNIFGHDPTSAIPTRWKGSPVTRSKYLYYKARRRLGYGMQGVGPGQLTWYALQDQADKLGGCYKVYPNLCVSFSNLKRMINAYGKEKGAASYNGTGNAADAYGRDFVKKQEAWHRQVS